MFNKRGFQQSYVGLSLRVPDSSEIQHPTVRPLGVERRTYSSWSPCWGWRVLFPVGTGGNDWVGVKASLLAVNIWAALLQRCWSQTATGPRLVRCWSSQELFWKKWFPVHWTQELKKLRLSDIKHKLEARLPGEISITSDMQTTPPLWQKAKKN